MLVVRNSLRAAVAVRNLSKTFATTSIRRNDEQVIPVRTPASEDGRRPFKNRGRPSSPQRKERDHGAEPEPIKRRRALKLKSLPLDATEEDLREAFAPYGDIRGVQLVKDGGPIRQGYVEYQLPDHAARAVAAINAGELTVKGQIPWSHLSEFRIQIGQRTSTIRVMCLPKTTTANKVQDFFRKYGDVIHVHLGRCPGEAFVDFTSGNAAHKVVTMHQSTPLRMGVHSLKIAYASPTRSVRTRKAKISLSTVNNTLLPSFRRMNPPQPKIFVTGLNRSFLADDLRSRFGAFGEVKSVDVSYYPESSFMNAAIEFSKTEEATEAVEAWKKGVLSHMGRHLRMDYAVDIEGAENPPFYMLRFTGFSGGKVTLKRFLKPFRPVIHTINLLGESERVGKGLGVAYVEFDTIESATNVKKILQGKRVGKDERLIITYAKQQKDSLHNMPGGHWGQDSGGADWRFGLSGREEKRLVKSRAQQRREELRQRETLINLGAMVEHFKPPPQKPRKKRGPSLIERLLARNAGRNMSL